MTIDDVTVRIVIKKNIGTQGVLCCTNCYAMYTAVNLDAVSLNIRGIREQTKRRSISSYLKDQRANVYFLQETYSEPADENM